MQITVRDTVHKRMHCYTAYGLVISSEVPLAEFIPATGSADVLVKYVDDAGWKHQPNGNDYHAEVKGLEACFWFADIGTIIVRNGKTIDIEASPGADESLIRLYIEGMIMAMLLHQRGLCVLHASVVDIAGQAVAFLGPVGAGKSSIAAALQARGHALISDDNAAVQLRNGSPRVVPAFPYLKLFPEIAAFLGYRDDKLHLLHRTQQKIAGSAAAAFATKALPLKSLYFIGREYSTAIRPVAASELLIELIRHSVPTRWGCPGDCDHLQRCGAVARRLKAYTVRTFDTLEYLPTLARRLEEHCISNGESTANPDTRFCEIDPNLLAVRAE